ncbi:uncharacterized protein BX664DRAFT_337516 [Halteromyces radiatus]|uniref:uncharacterized protein n=1 Tax=Halteromyces radiatus TaxID=101107 RepID=UPI00221F1B20|nr:uncharacterized protein BX664DRAFT_337516 [Halteromyces radiatus]KAI8084664.1 hypothetical protein BX664DRAFT_337516 [Halteromyces radiatus]
MGVQVANSVIADTNATLNKKNAQQPRKRNRKKSKKQRAEEEAARRERRSESVQENEDDLKDVEIEYVVQSMDASSLKSMDGMNNLQDDVLDQFSNIFRHFQRGKEEDEDETMIHREGLEIDGKTTNDVDNEENNSDTENKDQVLSKKKMKQLTRLSVAELKQAVSKPEAVDWWDANAQDPKLLIQLKSYRNTVPVPVHWSQKRKYLQNKRGIEKPPFELPEFIKDTGIMEMREAVKEKEDAAGLKSKMREKVAPKMGKLDVDYQKLHDAFFRFQTKPHFAVHGEMYYEGKENETKVQEKNPGQLSEELKQALNMPPLAPPPWLINMQRYGPPPNYPTLKVPGLNAPIPDGAQWGYHPGGWGRPPVDELNRPLYGDVFGVTEENKGPQMPIEPVDRTLFGQLESDEELEESEEEEEEEETKEEEEKLTDETLKEGLVTPSGIASVSTVASGLETPDVIELRKEIRRPTEEETPKQLYQVLPEMEKKISGLMGSQHGYDLQNIDKPVIAPTSGRMATSSSKRKHDNVDVAIDPSELESGLDESTLRAKYEAQVKSKLPGGGANAEDLSDMYAEHASRQAAKKKKPQDASKGKQKEREFKF